ncbi:hypothetical protein JTE90_024064 [Oedothorax gibbosus]|uniref:Uncharacterized protein n=1 Tax=Oedothorax gibbosus TaxID=931172 RepID=A0AAV6TD44_9ARAC|nr:hypothetical protein JTE90_024064 [Oedothorax gibbosus]
MPRGSHAFIATVAFDPSSRLLLALRSMNRQALDCSPIIGNVSGFRTVARQVSFNLLDDSSFAIVILLSTRGKRRFGHLGYWCLVERPVVRKGYNSVGMMTERSKSESRLGRLQRYRRTSASVGQL